MALQFIRAANPVWNFVDLVGQPLNDEYYAFFLSNTFPYIPQPVYRGFQDTSATWPYILEFQPGGTLPNNLYFNPDLVYRIEIRHGNTQSDPLIYEINNFVPGNGSGEDVSNVFDNSENQITNPQFSDINFVSPLTYTAVSGGEHRVQIAPGWELVVTGIGHTTLTQLPLSGNTQEDIENPPYALQIDNNGWSEAALVQRFQQNGAIFAGGAIAASVTARAYSVSQQLSVIYEPSTASGEKIIISSQTVPIDAFIVLHSAANLDASLSTDKGDDAYVDIIIQLNPTNKIDITNVQIIGQSTQIANIDNYNTNNLSPVFFEETIERGIDHEFHYYKPQLEYKPIPSYTIGWDFPSNPGQALGSSATYAAGANSARYIADQTIAFQTVTNSLYFTLRPNSVSNPGGLTIYNNAISSWALIQYLDGAEAFELLSGRMAVKLNGYVLGTPDTLVGTVNLYWTTNANVPVLPLTFFATLSGTGADIAPTTLTAGWFQVPKNDLLGSSFTLTTTPADYNFNSWDATGQANVANATAFAIVVSFNTMQVLTSVTLEFITLCRGDIATTPPAMNTAQTLQALQYYYQKSFIQGLTPANAVTLSHGESYFTQTHATTTIFPVNFTTEMRANPTITFYNPVNNNSNVYNVSTASDSGSSAIQLQSNRTFCMAAGANGGSSVGDLLAVNWVCDARYGVV